MSAKPIREYDGKRLLSKHLRDADGRLQTPSLCAQVRPRARDPLQAGTGRRARARS